MRLHHLPVLAALVTLAAGLLAGSSQAAGKTASAAAKLRAERPITQLIVRYKDGQAAVMAASDPLRLQALSAKGGVRLTYRRAMSGHAHVLALPKGGLPRAEAQALAKRVQSDPSVAYAEPDDWVYPALEPTDPYYLGTGSVPRGQWHFKNPTLALSGLTPIGAADFPAAWNSATGSGVVVAVIDTGVVAHADLAGQVIAGHDFVTDVFMANDGDGRDGDPTDPGDWVTSADLSNPVCANAAVRNSSWHGTHVAGVVAALANTSWGVGGAFGARVLNVRALGKCGGYTSDIIDAMRWAAGLSVFGVASNSANVAKVINLSLGSTGACSISFQSAVNEIRAAGKVVVAATGNEAGAVDQPANCTGVIAVTAHTYEGDNAEYANYGSETTLSAPGGGACTQTSYSTCSTLASNDPARFIWSTWNTGTTVALADALGGMAGTSMAAPHVSAAAALLLGQQASLSPDNVALLLTSSTRLHPLGSFCYYATGMCGSGLLDAGAAVARLASNAPIVTAAASPTLVASGVGVNLSASVATLSAGAPFTYLWSQDSGPAAVLQNSTSSSASFIAPATGGLMVLRLTVTDANQLTASDSVEVRVNNPPVFASSSQNVSATAGVPMTLSLAASDADGDSLTYSANGLPAGATLAANSGAFAWASPVVGSYTFTVLAADGYSNGLAMLTVNLTVSDAPPASGGGGGALGGLGLMLLAVAGWLARRRD